MWQQRWQIHVNLHVTNVCNLTVFSPWSCFLHYLHFRSPSSCRCLLRSWRSSCLDHLIFLSDSHSATPGEGENPCEVVFLQCGLRRRGPWQSNSPVHSHCRGLELARIPPVLIKPSVLERIKVVISQTSPLPHSPCRGPRRITNAISCYPSDFGAVGDVVLWREAHCTFL